MGWDFSFAKFFLQNIFSSILHLGPSGFSTVDKISQGIIITCVPDI